MMNFQMSSHEREPKVLELERQIAALKVQLTEARGLRRREPGENSEITSKSLEQVTPLHLFPRLLHVLIFVRFLGVHWFSWHL